MNRTKKLKMNTVMSFINRIVRIISGLILPRLILLYFGSKTNGLVASINQFLSIVTFLDLGVGSVVQSALYRPLADKNDDQINKIISAGQNYFKKIAYVLVGYVAILIFFFPLIIDSSLGFLPTIFLIISLSISIFGQYYFGIVNELLLNADQRGYIQYASEIVTIILNVIVSVVLIRLGASIQIVKLGAGLVFLSRPIYLSYYVNKNFNINNEVVSREDPLPQKWNGMGQHIAYSIHNSTDIVTLTFFSTLENVSIYSIYNMIVQAIVLIISSVTTGIGSFFGSLLADDEHILLNNYFGKIEWGIHTGVIFLYSLTIVLIDSFVLIYTSGVEDINYYAPLFSLLLVISKTIYSLRTPYQSLIFSAGHFKQTQLSSFVEAGINIIISVLMVNQFGLVGVAMGTLVSMLYRTIYLVIYLSKNIIFRPLNHFIKQITVDIVTMISIVMTGRYLLKFFNIVLLTDWILLSLIFSIIAAVIVIAFNLIFYRSMVVFIKNNLLRKSKRL